MFSIPQLLKTIRKLQANGISGSDLVKSLQNAAIVGNNNSSNNKHSSTTTHVDIPPIWLTSLLSAQGMTSSISSIMLASSTLTDEESEATTVLPKQPQQASESTSHEHEITENENSSEASNCEQSSIESGSSAGNSDSNCHKLSVAEQHVVSLYSNLNQIGSLLYTESTCTTTQDSNNINTATTTIVPATTTTQKYFCNTNRSQSIQNFYQQQLHQFHTQHNQSLYAKQKQTQFAMSSLAAEPLSLKSQDDILTNHIISNGDDAKLNGNEKENDSNSSLKSVSAPGSPAAVKPCFNTGLAEILQFMELIGNLKHTKRTGWVLRDVNDCESISGHMYRMSMMTFLLDGTEGLNQIRCMELALVHDLAESLVGDITPFCGVSKDDKRALEFKAMEDICKLIEPRGKRIMVLFEEYEHGQSAESKFVKDLDRLDMVMQAFEYEKRDNCLLKHQEFFDSTEGKFQHPFVKKLVQEIYEQRRVLAKAKGAAPPPRTEVPNMEEIARKLNGHCTVARQQQEQTTSTSTS